LIDYDSIIIRSICQLDLSKRAKMLACAQQCVAATMRPNAPELTQVYQQFCKDLAEMCRTLEFEIDDKGEPVIKTVHADTLQKLLRGTRWFDGDERIVKAMFAYALDER
jgi:hypothetical protein